MKLWKYAGLAIVCRAALLITRDSDIYDIAFPVVVIVLVGLGGLWGYRDIKRHLQERKLKNKD